MAQQPGATLLLQPAERLTGPGCLRVAVLPRYPAGTASEFGQGGASVPPGPQDAWQAALLAGEQVLPLRWPRGPQDAAWAQGVLANQLVAAVTVPAGTGPWRLRAEQRDLAFDGAELLPGPCH